MTTSPPEQAGTPLISVATLRRSSSHVTPTRTLRLSEHESTAAGPPIAANVVLTHAARPRSNQRTRTPRRQAEENESSTTARREVTTTLVSVNHYCDGCMVPQPFCLAQRPFTRPSPVTLTHNTVAQTRTVASQGASMAE